MKKSFIAPLLSILLFGITITTYIILKHYVSIPKELAVIVLVGLLCIISYFIYFCFHKSEFINNDEEDIVEKTYKNYL